jgi:hypothetical protein
MTILGLWLLTAAVTVTATPAADNAVGEITAVDLPTRQITLKSDGGDALRVSVLESATVLRVRPGAKDLNDATPCGLGEAAVGDRAFARGRRSADGTLEARRIVLINRDDLAQKHQAETEDWKKRGVHGIVEAVDVATSAITVRLGRRPGAPALVIGTAEKRAVLRRYAPDSVRFVDARPSSLAEVKKGDELRALGDRSTDGSTLTAEQVVFGTFRVVTGRVVSLDAASGQLVVHDDDARQDVTVAVGSDARLRRLPPEMAARLARRSQAPDGAEPDPPRRAEGSAGPGPGAGAWRMNPEEMIERMPSVTVGDLKPGDRVMVSSTVGQDVARLNAIVLVSGLEALQMPSGSRRGGGGRGGVDVGLPAELLDMGMSLQ